MDNTMAKLPFEASGWGCINAVENAVDTFHLEWIYKNKGGWFIFEYIDGKVRGELPNIKAFKKALDRIFDN